MGSSTSKLEKELAPGFPESERLFGLENFGNTCYCNAVLQALYFCLPFRQQILAGHNPEAANGANDTLLMSLGELFTTISQQRKKTGVLGPKKFVQILRRENEMFRGYSHQDAHEFLNYLLNDVIEQLNGTKGSAGNGGGSQKKKPPPTWVEDIFEGLITSETKCLCCETITSRDEAFLDLSLEISENSSVTSCLRNFSSTETLSGRDKFFCNTCGSLQEAQKRIKVKRQPNTLALHLKRFKYIESLQRFKKLTYRVVFPFELKLFNVVKEAKDPDKTYHLFAVVVHVGSGTNHGHYVSAVKINHHWFLFDDDSVELIEEGDIHSYFGITQDGIHTSDSGYILFYQSEDDPPVIL
mmetsp:Transcript_36189/g.82481  ORF Transcript_36189/g.82481 Transcript_36189/m.82481 type:complete len:355 (-) Transcript_36189:3-1067(-)|eukprot:CAMPEP_0114569260 /NCGR_PEP_ID=MMETSP0114-20121206/16525_1 /TAXON_ID=31324 /ORGANISM="Goniomonas sp, Strain m" /LENGTH=354 /DNA_ID=CAMNT_0001756115 /DNA_START=83 /DNA_END=1147 /DNA_ORIENTATION=-